VHEKHVIQENTQTYQFTYKAVIKLTNLQDRIL